MATAIIKADGITDDTNAVQLTIDQAIASGERRVYLPDGNIKISDTLHLGYGDGYSSVSLHGSMDRPAVHVYGTFIRPTFTDRPVINIQGARHCELTGFGIVGQVVAPPSLSPYATAWGVAFPDNRNKQFAGISIDAFSGDDPGDGYTAPKGWRKNHSSDVNIRAVSFQNLGCGVITKPSGGAGADNNGDYITVDDCYFTRCKYAWSVNGSQTRHNTMQRCKAINCYAAVGLGHYGAKLGRSVWVKDSKVEGCNWVVASACTDWLGQVSVENVSGEGTSGCVNLSNAGGNCVVTIRGCDMQLLDGEDVNVEERVWVRAPGSALIIENNRVISNGNTKPTLIIEGGRINQVRGNIFQSPSTAPKYVLLPDRTGNNTAKLGPNLISNQGELTQIGVLTNPLLFNAVVAGRDITGVSPSVLHNNAKVGDVVASKSSSGLVRLYTVIQDSTQTNGHGAWLLRQVVRMPATPQELAQSSVNYIMRPTVTN